MAIQDPTTNFGWDLPTVGGSTGSWGTELNTIFGDDVTGIDKVVGDIKTTADAALARAGGTMTGRLKAKTSDHALVAQGETMSGTETLDLDAGNIFHGKATGAVTLAFSNIPTGVAVFWMLELENGGASGVSFPASVVWAGGSAPVLTASGFDVLGFFTNNGGTKVFGFPLALDAS